MNCIENCEGWGECRDIFRKREDVEYDRMREAKAATEAVTMHTPAHAASVRAQVSIENAARKTLDDIHWDSVDAENEVKECTGDPCLAEGLKGQKLVVGKLVTTN